MATNKDQEKPGVRDYSVLIEPVVTEKTASLSGTQQCVAFRVRRDADVTEIRAAVEKIFNVKVEAVRVCNYRGKPKRVGRSLGQRAATKKAYITLKEGQRLEVVEGL